MGFLVTKKFLKSIYLKKIPIPKSLPIKIENLLSQNRNYLYIYIYIDIIFDITISKIYIIFFKNY